MRSLRDQMAIVLLFASIFAAIDCAVRLHRYLTPHDRNAPWTYGASK